MHKKHTKHPEILRMLLFYLIIQGQRRQLTWPRGARAHPILLVYYHPIISKAQKAQCYCCKNRFTDICQGEDHININLQKNLITYDKAQIKTCKTFLGPLKDTSQRF